MYQVLCMRFGLTMMKYDFTSPPPKVGFKFKVVHRQMTGHINRPNRTDIHTFVNRDHTSNWIGKRIGFMMGKVI